MSEQLWEYEVAWSWGRHIPLVESFTVIASDDTEARKKIERKLRYIARRYSFDCGRLEYPLSPLVGSVRKKPFTYSEHVKMDLQPFLQREVEWTKRLIKQDKLWVNHDYNLEPAPETVKEEEDGSSH
jgi:hypothetical protein